MEKSEVICNQPDNKHTKILKKIFGHNKFKPEQWDVIRAIIDDKRDCFIVAGTGFGKSLIYQFPPVFLHQIAIVICPSISLMENQVLSLKQKGIKACLLGSIQKDSNIKLQKYQVVYLTAEFFNGMDGRAKLSEIKDQICLIAIDECHCITQWGSNFHPRYRELANLKSFLPNIPIVCLTATATGLCRKEVCVTLCLVKPLIVKADLNRPNLNYSILHRGHVFVEDVKSYLISVTSGSVIIYVLRRRETEQFSEALNREGFPCRPYHAGMSDKNRREVLKEFAEGSLRFIVATISFGMGIDRSDVRTVIHYGSPKSIESYYQESGRAGRDCAPSNCVIFWENRDFEFHRYWMSFNDKISPEHRAHCERLIKHMESYLVSTKCLRMEILRYFDESTPQLTIRESCCDNCTKSLHNQVPLYKMYQEIDRKGFLNVAADARLLLALVKTYQGKCDERKFLKFFMSEMPSKHHQHNSLELFAKGKPKPEAWWLKLVGILIKKKMIKRYIEVQHIPVANEGDEEDMEVELIVRRDDFLKITTRGKKFLRRKTLKMNENPSLDIFQFLTKTKREYYIEDGKVKHKPRVLPQHKEKVAKSNHSKAINSSQELFKFDLKKCRLRNSSEKLAPIPLVNDSSVMSHDVALPDISVKENREITPNEVPDKHQQFEHDSVVDDGAGCSSWSRSTVIKVENQNDAEVESDGDLEDDECLKAVRMKISEHPLAVDFEELWTYLENKQLSETSQVDNAREASREMPLNFSDSDDVLTPPSLNRLDLIESCSLNYALKRLASDMNQAMDEGESEIASKSIRLSQEIKT